MERPFDKRLSNKKLKKSELDLLSYEELQDYKSVRVQKDNPDFRYCDELGLYMDIRFKSTVYAQYDEYIRLSKIDAEFNEYGMFTDSITGKTYSRVDQESHKLLAKVLEGDGKDALYNHSINSTRVKLGTSQYELYN